MASSYAQPSDKGKSVVKQFETLKSIRSPLDREYRECYEYTKPSLGVGATKARTPTASATHRTRRPSSRGCWTARRQLRFEWSLNVSTIVLRTLRIFITRK